MDSGGGMPVMDKRDIALIWLSLQLTIMSYQLYKDSTARAYLQGQMDIYNSFKSDGTEGTCLVPKSQGGCK